jgi:hypothetical protein
VDEVSRSDRHEQVEHLRKDSPELATLFDAIRGEFDAKISSLKAWGVAMCLGGGVIGGLTTTVTELARPGSVSQAIGFLGLS